MIGATGAVRMRLVNGAAVGGTWRAFASSRAATLTALDGTRPIAAQFGDAYGNVSTVALDDIILGEDDQTMPLANAPITKPPMRSAVGPVSWL